MICLHDSNDALYFPTETENHLWDIIDRQEVHDFFYDLGKLVE